VKGPINVLFLLENVLLPRIKNVHKQTTPGGRGYPCCQNNNGKQILMGLTTMPSYKLLSKGAMKLTNEEGAKKQLYIYDSGLTIFQTPTLLFNGLTPTRILCIIERGVV